MRTRRLSIIALFVAMVAAFTMAFVSSVKVAKADTTFAFEEGAYVKLSGDGGLRFRLKMDEAKATEIKGNDDETLYFYVASATRMDEVTTGAQAKALYSAGNAWEVTVDKDKIYAGEDGNGDPDGYYYANVLIDANNIGADAAAKLVYRTTDFVAAATLYDASSTSYTSFVKSVERSMQDTASMGALRGGYYDDVTAVYDWLGTSEDYAFVAANAADYTALATALSADDSLYFYLDGVADTENLCATYAAHSGISDLGVMKTIVPTVTNGSIVYDTANEEYTATATADTMYIYLSHNGVNAYSNGKEYMKLVVSSSTGATFLIVPMTDANVAGDGNWSYYPLDTVSDTAVYYIPLNDSEVHDWSKYDLRIYIGYNTQVLTIEEISFYDVDEMDIVSNLRGGSVSAGVYTAGGSPMYIGLNRLVIADEGAGKDFVKITLNNECAGVELNILPKNSSGTEDWLYIYTSLLGEDPFYVPLNDPSVHDFSKFDLYIVARAGQALSIVNIEYITEAERYPVIAAVTGGSGSGNVYTAGGSPMYVYINHEYVQYAKGSNTFIKFVLSSSGGAEFNILPTNSSGTQDWYYVYETLFSETYYVPLNDASIHDWSQYNLALVVRAGQNVTISEMSFVTINDFPDFIYAVRRGSVDGNSYTATAANMELYISMWRVRYEGTGKDYLKLTLSATALTEFTLKLDSNVYYYQTLGGSNNVFYVPLADVRVRDMNSHWLSMVAGNAGGNITIDNIEYVTQAEKDAA